MLHHDGIAVASFPWTAHSSSQGQREMSGGQKVFGAHFFYKENEGVRHPLPWLPRPRAHGPERCQTRKWARTRADPLLSERRSGTFGVSASWTPRGCASLRTRRRARVSGNSKNLFSAVVGHVGVLARVVAFSTVGTGSFNNMLDVSGDTSNSRGALDMEWFRRMTPITGGLHVSRSWPRAARVHHTFPGLAEGCKQARSEPGVAS